MELLERWQEEHSAVSAKRAKETEKEPSCSIVLPMTDFPWDVARAPVTVRETNDQSLIEEEDEEDSGEEEGDDDDDGANGSVGRNGGHQLLSAANENGHDDSEDDDDDRVAREMNDMARQQLLEQQTRPASADELRAEESRKLRKQHKKSNKKLTCMRRENRSAEKRLGHA